MYPAQIGPRLDALLGENNLSVVFVFSGGKYKISLRCKLTGDPCCGISSKKCMVTLKYFFYARK